MYSPPVDVGDWIENAKCEADDLLEGPYLGFGADYLA